MSIAIRLAYATRYGSTRETAAAIGGNLSKAGFTVELQAARQVNTLDGFQAVQLGVPFYFAAWHGGSQAKKEAAK
jgi:menaquinone-dependent protoporphyrinogen oxidase